MELNDAFKDFANKAQEAAKRREELEQIAGWSGCQSHDDESCHLSWAIRARKSKLMTIELATSLDSRRDRFNMINRLYDARGYFKIDTVKDLLCLPALLPADPTTWTACLNKIRN